MKFPISRRFSRRGKLPAAAAYENHAAWRRSAAADNTVLAGVLQGDTLASYLFIIVIDYIMTVTIDDDESDSGFTLRTARSRRIQGLVPRILQTSSLQMMLPLSLIPLNYSWTGLRKQH